MQPLVIVEEVGGEGGGGRAAPVRCRGCAALVRCQIVLPPFAAAVLSAGVERASSNGDLEVDLGCGGVVRRRRVAFVIVAVLDEALVGEVEVEAKVAVDVESGEVNGYGTICTACMESAE